MREAMKKRETILLLAASFLGLAGPAWAGANR